MAVADSQRIIEMLKDIEEAVSSLYETYAGLFPEHAAFWQRLSDDEIRHRDWVAGLLVDVETGLITKVAHRSHPEAYINFLAFLEEQTDDAVRHPPTLVQALATARLVEQTYFERNILKVFDTDSDGVRRVLEGLAEDTERHYRALTEEWERHRPLGEREEEKRSRGEEER